MNRTWYKYSVDILFLTIYLYSGMQSHQQHQRSYQAPAVGSKIIIVGGGCFGLSTAYSLASNKTKNYEVWVYDREEIPVRDAASNGNF